MIVELFYVPYHLHSCYLTVPVFPPIESEHRYCTWEFYPTVDVSTANLQFYCVLYAYEARGKTTSEELKLLSSDLAGPSWPRLRNKDEEINGLV